MEQKCTECKKIFNYKWKRKTCSPECREKGFRKSMQKVYDSPEVKQKLREAINKQYKEGTRDKYETTRKAREVKKQKLIKRFKDNPRTYISKRGYKMIAIPMKGDMKYHHYIWKNKFGKDSIPLGFHLHHINLNKLDNNINNLQLLPINEHHKLHDRLRKRNKKGQYK